jgi:tripartite-type tricarboxylate transporter receptor subunit TctC
MAHPNQGDTRMKFSVRKWMGIACLLAAPMAVLAQPCPDEQPAVLAGLPPGGESDLSARHQQVVLKKKCPAIDTIIQYKAGAGGGLMWAQMNSCRATAEHRGINLPHIVFQPIEGEVQYKTADVTPVFWFHFTPDALVVPEASPYPLVRRFHRGGKANPGKMNLGGSGLNSANHASHERLMRRSASRAPTCPIDGTGDMSLAVVGNQIDGAVTYSAFAINNKGKVRALAVAMEQRHPLMPDVPTFRELGVDWGRRRLPRHRRAQVHLAGSTQAALRPVPGLEQRPGDEGPAAKSGFELVNVGLPEMDAFMKERTRVYTEGARMLGLGKK